MPPCTDPAGPMAEGPRSGRLFGEPIPPDRWGLPPGLLLHAGHWPDDEPHLTLEEAQARMRELIQQALPAAPCRVVWVGFALEHAAAALATQGFSVTVLSPDPAVYEYAGSPGPADNPTFVEGGLLSFAGAGDQAGGFEAVVLLEGTPWPGPLDAVLEAAARLLRRAGRLIWCDHLDGDGARTVLTGLPARRDLAMAAYEAGFFVKSQRLLGQRARRSGDEILGRLPRPEAGEPAGANDPRRPVPTGLVERWERRREWFSRSAVEFALLVLIQDGLRIRRYEPGDEPGILALFTEVFAAPRTAEHWNWKYRDHPLGRHAIALAAAEDGLLVAHHAGYPVQWTDTAGGKVLSVLQCGDTMTRPEYRNVGRGPTSLLARVLDYFYGAFCEGRLPLIYGFNTGTIRRFGERFLGYEYAGTVPLHSLDAGRLPGFSVFPWVAGYRVARVTALGPEWDDFFHRAAGGYGLLTTRTSTYLRWRYLDCPDRVHTVAVVRRRGTIVGWGVFSRRGDTVVWGDALFSRDHPAAARVLLRFIVTQVFPGAVRIEGWFSPSPRWWSQLLADLGFTVGPEPNDLTPCFRIFDPAVTASALDRDLYYTMGDSDLF